MHLHCLQFFAIKWLITELGDLQSKLSQLIDNNSMNSLLTSCYIFSDQTVFTDMVE